MAPPKSFKEQRIRKITHLYYSRPEIQNTIFEFCKNREISPRYFEGFGKRPDSFQYKNDIFELVRRGATSFHCSEEIWQDPLKIITGMTEEQANQIRDGWDLLIDIDCKWFDYSKLATSAILNVLKNHKVKNIGLKFSGSKGWHIIIPWSSFPKKLGREPTKNLFPELPRKIINYIRFKAEEELKQILPENFYQQFKSVKIKKGIKCETCKEIADQSVLVDFYCPNCRIGEQKKLLQKSKQILKCPNCTKDFSVKNPEPFYECNKCNIDSKQNPRNFSKTIQTDLFELMGLDLILVSPRHLFRTPYSLHEKTALASVVINPGEISSFEMKDADPMKIQPKDFMPSTKKEEAKELVMQALDWDKEQKISRGESEEKITGKFADYKPVKLSNISDATFPPCVQRILAGIADGKKRAVFILINLFRSIGMEKEDMEKKIYAWNEKNKPPIKKGYIQSQLAWTYKRKPLLPPNCKEFYKGIGVCLPDQFCSQVKNPVNYVVKKNFSSKKKKK